MTFLGIDQTGAVNTKGRPKPLPSCLIKNNNVSFFYAEAFSEDLKKYKPRLICIDCVLGLPKSTGITLREAIQLTEKINAFGRKPAQNFFENMAKGKTHNRKIETTLGANSVFTVHPFQKNIQTGTFRFWKEMAQSPDWFYLPALPNERKLVTKKIPVVEGYPSYYWKVLLNEAQRRPHKIVEILKIKYPHLKLEKEEQKDLLNDANLADALLLALAAQKFQDEIKRAPHAEGWILGFK